MGFVSNGWEAFAPNSPRKELAWKLNGSLPTDTDGACERNLFAAGVDVGVVDSTVFVDGLPNIPWPPPPKILVVGFVDSFIEEAKPDPKNDFSGSAAVLSSSFSFVVSGVKLEVNVKGCDPKGLPVAVAGLELGAGNEEVESVDIDTSGAVNFGEPNMLGLSALTLDATAANPPWLAKLEKPAPAPDQAGPAELLFMPDVPKTEFVGAELVVPKIGFWGPVTILLPKPEDPNTAPPVAVLADGLALHGELLAPGREGAPNAVAAVDVLSKSEDVGFLKGLD